MFLNIKNLLVVSIQSFHFSVSSFDHHQSRVTIEALKSSIVNLDLVELTVGVVVSNICCKPACILFPQSNLMKLMQKIEQNSPFELPSLLPTV